MDVFCLDVAQLMENADELLPYLSILRLNKVQGMVDSARKAQSLGVELALCYAVKYIDKNGSVPVNYYYSGSGKPILIDYPDYSVSFAHTYNMSVVAIGKVEVGVDVEYRKDIKYKYASKLLSDEEYLEFINCDESDRKHFLLDNFVKKESYVKATGVGLTTFPSKIVIPAYVSSSVSNICDDLYVLGVTMLKKEDVNIHYISLDDVLGILK